MVRGAGTTDQAVVEVGSGRADGRGVFLFLPRREPKNGFRGVLRRGTGDTFENRSYLAIFFYALVSPSLRYTYMFYLPLRHDSYS